jgi:hypothetical protein
MSDRFAPGRSRLTAAALALTLGIGPLAGPALGQVRQVPETRQQIALSFAPVVRQSAAAVVNVYGARVEWTIRCSAASSAGRACSRSRCSVRSARA